MNIDDLRKRYAAARAWVHLHEDIARLHDGMGDKEATAKAIDAARQAMYELEGQLVENDPDHAEVMSDFARQGDEDFNDMLAAMGEEAS